MIIDTHCHLHDREFFTEAQAEEMLERAHKKGIEKIICIGTNPEDSMTAHDFAVSHDNVYWTYGVHPEYAKEGFEYNFSREFGARQRENERRSPVATGRPDATREVLFIFLETMVFPAAQFRQQKFERF